MSSLTPFKNKQATASLETAGSVTERLATSTKEMTITTVTSSLVLAGLTDITFSIGAETAPLIASIWGLTTASCAYLNFRSSLSRELQFWRLPQGGNISTPGILLNYLSKDKRIPICRDSPSGPEIATLVINRGQVFIEKPVPASEQWDTAMQKVQSLYGLPEKRKLIDMCNSNCPVERMHYKRGIHKTF